MGRKTYFWLAVLAILVTSFFIYVYHYDLPAALFWDENYHIASAQKYIDGTFFMEPHPPLGKMLIAAGEALLHPNDALDTGSFIGTDYIKTIPAGYSFAGVRLFPVLFAALTPLLLFLILYIISERLLPSFTFTLAYILCNSIILQFRGAMLDGIQMFFILLSLLLFVIYFKRGRASYFEYLCLGAVVGLAIAVKLNSAILLLLFPALYLKERWPAMVSTLKRRHVRWPAAFRLLRDLPLKAVLATLGVVGVLCAIFYLHFVIGQTVVDGRYYAASDTYKAILERHDASDPRYFGTMLSDSIRYMQDYERKAPRLDEAKPVENGSRPFEWVLGRKSINYRWERHDGKVQYLYLQANPAVYLIGLLGIALAVILICAHYLFGLEVRNRACFSYILLFTILYACYMAAMLMIDRVMYQYHYFIPLLFSLILAFLIFNYLFDEYLARDDPVIVACMILMVLWVLYFFLFYAPFTYYLPLSTQEFVHRNIFSYWGLKYV
jgi:dolichyl-phosphate-mannose--protein O-mannosyl transferase